MFLVMLVWPIFTIRNIEWKKTGIAPRTRKIRFKTKNFGWLCLCLLYAIPYRIHQRLCYRLVLSKQLRLDRSPSSRAMVLVFFWYDQIWFLVFIRIQGGLWIWFLMMTIKPNKWHINRNKQIKNDKYNKTETK